MLILLKRFQTLSLSILCLSTLCLVPTNGFAANLFNTSADAEFLQARAAYDKKNAIALSEYVQQLHNENYILAPYADYWLMLLNLEDADNQTVINFLGTYNEYPFSDRLRGEYLKKLGKNQDWASFADEIVNYQLEDPAVACYAAESSAINGDVSSLAGAKSLWMQAKEQPANCSNLYDRMQAAGVLSQDEIWDRFRLSLADGRVNLAKAIVKRAKTFDVAQYKLIDKAYASPAIVINKKLVSFKTRFGRELNLFALNRLAKTDSLQTLIAYKSVEGLFSAEEKGYFYGKLALQAAQRQEPQALQWFKLADELDKEADKNKETFNKDQLAWFVRSALREKNWPQVLDAINKMDAAQAEEGAWRYWKARALAAQGQTLEANTLFARLSTERHFYGWLAQDELSDSMSAPLNTYKVSDAEVSEIASTPAFQRAEALLRMDFRWEAKTEWAQATKGFDDKQLLAAAEFAARKNWYDLAIITADKTTEIHDYTLRYPVPYRNLMKPAAKDQGIDEAWVYGITRQESRFVYSARSNVGASGLMQLMPATAKWAAKRVGMDYNNSMIHALDTNIALGTYYLRYTLDLFNGQEVMATAAYNAGPNRAKKWTAPTPLEGAIYAETIPFSETRSYVQKVMANAHLYAYQLGLKSISLKQRLGTIPSNLGVPTADNPSSELVAEPITDANKLSE